MESTVLEVRCCCNPNILLGYVEIVNPIRDKVYAFPMKREHADWEIPGGYVELQVAKFSTMVSRDWDILDEPKTYLAVKSGHHSKEFLSKIDGFTPKN